MCAYWIVFSEYSWCIFTTRIVWTNLQNSTEHSIELFIFLRRSFFSPWVFSTELWYMVLAYKQENINTLKIISRHSFFNIEIVFRLEFITFWCFFELGRERQQVLAPNNSTRKTILGLCFVWFGSVFVWFRKNSNKIDAQLVACLFAIH